MKILLPTVLAILVPVLVIAPANAQIIEKKSLNLDGAKKAIAAAVDYAKKNNAPGGVVAVVDEGGNLMALERLDGTFAMGATISIRSESNRCCGGLREEKQRTRWGSGRRG